MFISGKFKFVPSKFIRPPREFRMLYGPNVRQTMIDGFFNAGELDNSKIFKPRIKKSGISIRQSKVEEYFKLKKM